MAGTGALQPAPFVNAEYMARHMNSVVRVVGTLVDASPGNVKLKTSDAQIVSVTTAANGAPYGRADVVEVMGVVNGPNSLVEVSHVDYIQPPEKPFNFDNYNKMVQLYAQQATCFSVS